MRPIARRCALLLVSVLLLWQPAPAAAQVAPGTVDAAFDAGVIDYGFGSGSVRAVVLQPDGRILIGGAFSEIAGVTRHGIARLNADGSVDTTFAAPFFVTSQVPYVLAMALQPDGKILIGGGGFNVGPNNYYLARLMPDGSLDPAFTLLPMNISRGIEAITLLPDGRFFVGGDYGSIGNVDTRVITLMTAGGTVDPSFTISAFQHQGRALSIVRQPDGNIVAGGDFIVQPTPGSPIYGNVARFSMAGVLDTTFHPVLIDVNVPVPLVKSLALRDDGTIYAGGIFRSVDGAVVHGLARLTSGGALMPSFNPGVHLNTDDFTAIRFDLQGRLLVTGNMYFPGTGPSDERRGIARLNADTGAFDAFYPPQGFMFGGYGYALAVQPDGKVLVGGGFAGLGGVTRWHIARLLDRVNTAPAAVPDGYTTTVNTPLPVAAPGVMANDTDADGDPLTAALVTGPASGALTLNANGSFTYTPALNFAGNVSFTYRVSDGPAMSAPATVSIAVLPPAFISAATGAPFPGGTGLYTGFLGGPALSGGLLAVHASGTGGQQGLFTCDRSAPADPCVPVVAPSTPIPGGSGAFTGFNGLTVAGQQTAFIGGGAGGQQGIFTCGPGDPCVPLAAVGGRIPGGTGAFTGFGDVALATGTAVPTPPALAGFIGSGVGQQGVFVCQPGDPCAPVATLASAIPGGTGTFTSFQRMAITPDTALPQPPSIVAFVGSGAAGQQGVFRCSASAIPTDPCTPVATSATAIPGGTGAFTGFTQLAAAGRFTAFVGTGSGGQIGVYSCDSAIPTDPCTPIATRTTAIPGGAGTFTDFGAISTSRGHTAFLGQGANGQVGIYAASVLQKIVAVGDTLAGKTIASLRLGRDALDGAHLAFAATFTDGSEAAFIADLPLTNRAPVAGGDHTATTEDAAITIDVVANDTDADADTLAVVALTMPAHGVAAITGARTVRYTPAPGYAGPDAFSYVVDDGHGGSDTGAVTVSVAALNDAPAAVGDSYTTPEDTLLNVIAPGVLLNDSDPDGPTLSAQLVTNAAHGTVLLGASGALVYTPAPNYNGLDAFTYRASDGTLTSDVVTATILVTAVNDVPTAVADAYGTATDAPLSVAAPGVLANDTDAEGGPLTAVLVSPPASGTVVLNADGSFTYTPSTDTSGPVTFTYRATDGVAASAPATVTITVSPATPTAAWRPTGSLLPTAAGQQGRNGHTATLLANGTVLVVGGFGANPDVPRSAQLYDPATGGWTRLAHMPSGRAGHTATRLLDGRVLIAGGFQVLGSATPVSVYDSCLLFDPATGAWTSTGSFVATASGPTGRSLHTATLLNDGRVLVAAGIGVAFDTPRDAQLYDPATGAWTRTPRMTAFDGRAGHTATLLADGRVLVVGGYRIVAAILPIGFLDTAQIFTPATGTWSATASLRSTTGGNQGRAAHTATLLGDGRVLVAGGAGVSPDVPRWPQIYDPASGDWSFGAIMPLPRADHTATRLADGRVLLAGGQSLVAAVRLGATRSSQLYDPATNTWVATAGLNAARSGHTATLLPSGEVLAVAGVSVTNTRQATAERYRR
jgi:uncharacterized delta-60 repeat protein